MKHKMMAERRLRIKRNFDEQKRNGADKKELIKDYLGSMGHNIKSAALTGTNTDLKATQNVVKLINFK